MRDIFYAVFLLVGPILGLASYVLGPLGAVGASLVRVQPWWMSPILGIVSIPLLTVLFTPVTAFNGSPLPMPLPWLLAFIVDRKSATFQALRENGVILAAVYTATLLAALSFRGIATVISQRRSGNRSVDDEG